jgi:hypothetical protein
VRWILCFERDGPIIDRLCLDKKLCYFDEVTFIILVPVSYFFII